jgi:hypothetical protein
MHYDDLIDANNPPANKATLAIDTRKEEDSKEDNTDSYFMKELMECQRKLLDVRLGLTISMVFNGFLVVFFALPVLLK